MSQAGDPSARTIRCSRCDSPIALTELSPSVRCGYCGARQSVDPALLAELRAYGERVDGQLRTAAEERDVAAAWARSAAQIERGTKLGSYLRAFALLAGLPALAAVIGIALIQRGVIAPANTVYVSWMAMGAAGLGITLYYALYFARQRRKRAAPAGPPAAAIRCPECGAGSELLPGRMLERCQHCGAALLPSAGVRGAAVDAARQERRLAALEKHRAERVGYAALGRVGMQPTALIGFIGGSFLLMIGGGSVAFSWLMLIGDEPYSPAIFGMWAATLALVAGMVVAIRSIRGRQRRVRQALGQLARSFGGRSLDGLSGAVAWLNQHWAGPSDPYELLPGSYYAAAELSISGYRLFVDVNPRAASQHHRAYSNILLPCAAPGASDDAAASLLAEEPARSIARRISAGGYEVELVEAGLIARAGPDVVPGLIRPASIAALAEPIADLARLAAELGAAPADG